MENASEQNAGGGASSSEGQVVIPDDRESFPTILAPKDTGEDDGGEKGGNGKDKDTPTFNFKESPEFQEISTRLGKAEERAQGAERRASRAEAQLQGFMSGRGREDGDRETKPDFEDLSGKSADELRDMFADDPHSFLGNLLRQARHEIREELSGEFESKSTTANREKAYDAFVENHADFTKFLDDGSLEKTLRSSPIHNALSAYYELAIPGMIEKATAELKETHKKELKEAEDRGRKDAYAKMGGRVLGDGPAGKPDNVNAKHIKSEQHGGDSTAALLARHRARRASRVT